EEKIHSPLCRPIDEGLYEVEPSVREVLLVELENQFGFERPFGLAKFLKFYLAHKFGLQLRSEIIRTQRWIAQAYLDPDSLVVEMTNFLESSLSEGDNAIGLPEQIQVVTTLEILTEPLELTNRQTEYQYLINNSRVFAYNLYGNFTNITERELIYAQVLSPTPSQQVSEATIPELIRALQDKNFSVRASAAEALGKIGSEATIPELIRALQDKNFSVRASAAEALGKIGSEATIPELIQALQDKNFSVRASAAEALGKIGSEATIPELIQALQDEDYSVRDSAAEALGKIGSESSIPALIQALQDEKYSVSDSVSEALNTRIANAIAEIQKSRTDKRDALFYEFLNKITALAKEELRSDRATIFVFDGDNQEFWSIIEEEGQTKAIEIRVPKNQGIVGEAAQKKPGEFVKVRDFLNDPHSTIAKQQAERTGYPVYNILAIPIFNEKNELLAVVEFLNKLKLSVKARDSKIPLVDRIEHQGFTNTDPKKFEEIAHIILKFLEGFKDLYETTRKMQRKLRFDEAMRSVSESHAEFPEIWLSSS
ncbi:MAG: GAF domain-containing protein, partial [Symploca sp. SIO1B1]|nr:GAF domain-containing protein [Symploca sp. SIO1B1]